MSGSELDQTVTTATLMEEAPPQMQEHLRVRSDEIGTDYKKVMQAIEGYLTSKKTWNTGPDDMDVDAVSKDPKERARAKAKVRVTMARSSPKVKAEARAKGKETLVGRRARRIRNPAASVLFAARLDILPEIVITEFVQ